MTSRSKRSASEGPIYRNISDTLRELKKFSEATVKERSVFYKTLASTRLAPSSGEDSPALAFLRVIGPQAEKILAKTMDDDLRNALGSISDTARDVVESLDETSREKAVHLQKARAGFEALATLYGSFPAIGPVLQEIEKADDQAQWLLDEAAKYKALIRKGAPPAQVKGYIDEMKEALGDYKRGVQPLLADLAKANKAMAAFIKADDKIDLNESFSELGDDFADLEAKVMAHSGDLTDVLEGSFEAVAHEVKSFVSDFEEVSDFSFNVKDHGTKTARGSAERVTSAFLRSFS
jgi:hypothetical protein